MISPQKTHLKMELINSFSDKLLIAWSKFDVISFKTVDFTLFSGKIGTYFDL